MERPLYHKTWLIDSRELRDYRAAVSDRPVINRHLLVEMYPGHKGEPTPRAFMQNGMRLEICKIVEHWETAHYSLFQVIASDGYLYTMRCHLDELTWELVMQRRQ